MKKVILIFLLYSGISNCIAQVPAIQFQKALGGTGGFGNSERAYSVVQTSDGGYIIAGYTTSHDGDITYNHGGSDAWIVKISSSGSIQWQKCFGGSDYEGATCIQQTVDSGYIFIGYNNANGGYVTGNHGEGDCWVVKLSSLGNLLWQKSLGGSKGDGASYIQQTSDSGYILAGLSESNDGDVTENHGFYDCWIVKLSPSGDMQWQKSYGSSGFDGFNSIRQTFDGGYICTGQSNSNDGDVTGHHGGWSDLWILKIDSSGDMQWQKSLGGSDNDNGESIQQTVDSGYIVAGSSASNDGDVTGNHGLYDFWIVKLSITGDIEWQKSLGGSGHDRARAINQTTDSGYVVCGYSRSIDGDVSGHKADYENPDYWIVKLSKNGTTQWQRCIGGNRDDSPYDIKPTTDEGYIVVGTSNSESGDISGNHGYYDWWVAKLGGIDNKNIIINTPSINIFPNPTDNNIFIKGTGFVSVKIYNTTGELIKEANNVDNISMADFPTGIYSIKLHDENRRIIYVDKIIKK